MYELQPIEEFTSATAQFSSGTRILDTSSAKNKRKCFRKDKHVAPAHEALLAEYCITFITAAGLPVWVAHNVSKHYQECMLNVPATCRM